MKEKISIIVPVYNTEKYLDRCLKSILEQEYNNIEIILVNDGSTDKSLQICNQYKNMDNRIIIINKKHTGVADTKNIGIDNATGEYIGFVDSDDYIDSRMFSILLNSAKKFNADIAMCDFKITTNSDYITDIQDVKCKEMNKKEAINELLYDKKIQNHMCVKLFKKELFNEIRCPIGRMFEDIFIMYKLFDLADKFSYVELPLYYYFQRSDSITNKITRDAVIDYIDSLFIRYYELKGKIKDIDLYNVYSIVNCIIKSGIAALKIKDYELYQNIIYNNYYQKLKKELELVSETALISILTKLEKVSFYLLKEDDCIYFQNFIETRNERKKGNNWKVDLKN